MLNCELCDINQRELATAKTVLDGIVFEARQHIINGKKCFNDIKGEYDPHSKFYRWCEFWLDNYKKSGRCNPDHRITHMQY